MRKRAATDEVHPVEVRREADGLADHATLCRERTFRGDEVCAEGGAVLLVRGEAGSAVHNACGRDQLADDTGGSSGCESPHLCECHH
jgi:hypothetical protein